MSTRYHVGVDFGGTHIRVAASDAHGNWVATHRVQTRSELMPDGVIRRIGDAIETTLTRIDGFDSTHPFVPASIGIGVPGLVDIARGWVRFLPNLPTQWRDVPLGDRMGERFGCPVRLLNDVRTATLGQWRFGQWRFGRVDRDVQSMVYVSIGTGVGGGLVLDGQLRLGRLGAAGELGHQTIVADGPRCGCGNRGCLESVASGPAIAAEGVRMVAAGLAPKLNQIVRGDFNAINPQTMAEAAGDDDAVNEALQRAFERIGIGLANVVTVIHPDLIVIGGGVSQIDYPYETIIATTIDERVRMFPTDDLPVVRSDLGDDAGLHGAIALAIDEGAASNAN